MNTLLRRCLPLFLAPLAFGQGSQLPKYTVATLPTASSQITYTVQVIDGTTNTDCTIGGASGHSAFNVICSVRWNGSAYVWAPANTTAGGGQVYPAAGVANSTGSAWGTSYAVGTAANDLVQLNSSSQLPAVSGALLTNLPFMSLTTTGTSGAATLSAGVLNIPQYSSGGGGGLIPTGTALLVGSFSGLDDDGDSNSRDIGVPTSVNCVHTTTSTCTVVFPSSHLLSVTNSAIDMTNLASWPVGISGANQQAAQYGSFQITTVPNGTTVTFTTPTTLTYTCGPCTGHIFDASQWGIWQFAFQPGIMGVATVYQVETTTQSAAANVGTWLAAISGSPKYYIDQTGQNDFAGGRTVAQVNADHQTVWAAVHTAGAKVLQSTMMPAQYGLTGVGNQPGQVNWFEWTQSRGITDAMKASGQYVDLYADPASRNLMVIDSKQPQQTANQIFASTVANVLLTQSSDLMPPIWGSYSNSGLGSDVPQMYVPQPLLYYAQDWAEFAVLHMDAGGFKGWEWFTSTSGSAINNWWNNHMNAGENWCSNYFGRDATTNDYSAIGCFHYAGSGSSSNYAYDRPTSAASGADDYIRKYPNGTVSLPGSTGTTPSTSPICPNGTNGTLTTTGCVSGAVSSVSNSDGSLAISPTAGPVVASCALASTTQKGCVVPDGVTTDISGGKLVAIGAAPSGAAGGDLGGTYPNPSVKGVNGVPLCTGFTPTNGQNLQYTTASSPNPCYTAATASGGSGAWTNISGTITPTNMSCTSTACTASAASTITFGSIPSTGTEIVIKYNYASSSAVALRCQLNGDTGSNYAYEGVEFGSGGTTILSATSSTFMFCGAASVLSTSGTVTIPFYAVTSRPRAMLFQDIGFASVSSPSANFHDTLGGLWNNTSSAVNSITIFPASGTITGSFSIYLVN